MESTLWMCVGLVCLFLEAEERYQIEVSYLDFQIHGNDYQADLYSV